MICKHDYIYKKELPALSWECSLCGDITTSAAKAIPNLAQWLKTL